MHFSLDELMSRILLVEDTLDVLEALAAALEEGQHEVTAVQTYQEALPLILAGAIELLVADLRLPDGDGAALAEEARRHDIPQILISGDAEAAVRLHER